MKKFLLSFVALMGLAAVAPPAPADAQVVVQYGPRYHHYHHRSYHHPYYHHTYYRHHYRHHCYRCY